MKKTRELTAQEKLEQITIPLFAVAGGEDYYVPNVSNEEKRA